jgi:hypothetical protein
MTEPVGVQVGTPTVPFTMLGTPDAAACEGDSCLVVLTGAVDAPVDGAPDAAGPGRRGVSR